jgi:hypothetical protein
MARAHHRGAGLQLIGDQVMHRAILHLHPVLRSKPPLDRAVGGKTFVVIEPLPQCLQHRGRDTGGFARRHGAVEHALPSPRFVQGEPGANRIAMDPEQAGNGTAAPGLRAGHHRQRVKPLVRLGMTLLLHQTP